MLNTLGHILSFLCLASPTSYKALVLYCYTLIRGMQHYEKAKKKKIK